MELRSCYFCGAIGDGLDAHDVDPDRAPRERDPLRIVLCAGCRTKLDRILDVVTDGPGVEDVGGSHRSTSGPSGPPDSQDRPDPVQPPARRDDVPSGGGSDGSGPSGEITFDDDAEDATSGGVDLPGVPDVGDDAGTAGDSGDVGSNAAATDPGRTAGADDPDGGVDVVPGPSTAEDGTTDADDAEGDRGGDARGGRDGVGGSADSGESGGDRRGGSDATPDDAAGTLRRLGRSGTTKYHKALRLLQNRTFPMARTDLVDVMASAYDLETDECDRIVDLAVERGLLVDDGGQLRRS